MATHDRTFWREVIAQKYQVPAGETIAPLSMELAGFVTSVDPELRDFFGYEILANWIHRSGKLSARDLDALRSAFLPIVLAGIGQVDTDTVFKRSFALLNLKELAAADLRMPFLTQASFDELLDLAVKAFSSEMDLRGYVAGKGWAHATAHGADLLRVLARNDKLGRQQQTSLIRSIMTRTRSAGKVFEWGEDARIAAALESVASRADVDAATFEAWFKELRAEHDRLWRGSFEISAYVRVRAQANTLTQLAALIARNAKPVVPANLREMLHATLAQVN